jgi:hypothetical protein
MSIAASHHHSGPLSPSTPSPDLSQLHRKQKPPLKTLPQTPTSPQLMSSSQNHASPSPSTYTSSAAATSQQFSSTPPSTMATSTQQSQQLMNAIPTPASSVTGAAPSNTQPNEKEDVDSDVRMRFGGDEFDMKPTLKEEEGDDSMDIDIEKHRRTDHDRHGGSTITSKPGMDRLQYDAGSPYLLCKICKVPCSHRLSPMPFTCLNS